MRLVFLTRVLYSEARKRNFIGKVIIIAITYTILSMVAINYQSYWSFVTADYNILAKLKILFLIFLGSFQAIDSKDVVLLLLTSLLFGLNLELVLRKLRFLASVGSLHITFGAGLITLAATGCASCGLSLASIVGLSAVLAALPFGGSELYVLSIVILVVSLYYNLAMLVKVCKIQSV